MKKLSAILACVLVLLCLAGCSGAKDAQIAATTLPVYEFTTVLCQGTPITVTRLITENVSCLHDYTLQVDQMRSVESCELVIISGAGLEVFLDDVLHGAKNTVDASQGLTLSEGGHHHGHDHDHGHVHSEDPHIWLSPANAMVMAENICHGLCEHYPQYEAVFRTNLQRLLEQLHDLQDYGEKKLSVLSCRELITFHDGFAYFAEAFDLTVLKAVEEESGSEASAAELIELIGIVREHDLKAIFIETNGADAAASVIAAETGARIYTLDMAMSGGSYFQAMKRNIDTIWEAMQ